MLHHTIKIINKNITLKDKINTIADIYKGFSYEKNFCSLEPVIVLVSTFNSFIYSMVPIVSSLFSFFLHFSNIMTVINRDS